MSLLSDTSPKHCAQKGFEFKWNKKLLKILSTIVFSILSLLLLLWLTLHPAKPEFLLEQLQIYQLNFSSPHLLNSSIQITLQVRNPNQKVGIYYDHLRTYASYKGQQISVETSIPPFYQGTQDTNLVSASLTGTGLPVAPSLRYEVGRDQANGNMVLLIKLDGRIRWKLSAWVSARYWINVNCVAILPLGPFNLNNKQQGTQCSTSI